MKKLVSYISSVAFLCSFICACQNNNRNQTSAKNDSIQNTFNYQKDFKRILYRTKDPKDNLSYEKLLKRFKGDDTTMTDYEVLALMIGFTDNSEYKPYQDLEAERSIYN